MRWVSPLVMSLVLLSSSRGRAETEPPAAEWESNIPTQSTTAGPAPGWQPATSSQAPPEDPPSPRPEQQLVSKWYGWQILLADAATVGATAATQSADVFLGSYFGLPFVVHLANGELGRSLGSSGLRLVLPLLFSNIMDTGPGYDGETSSGYYYGLLTGALLASVLDVSVLGWKQAPPDPPSAPRAERKRAPEPRPWLQPRVQPLPRGLSMGIVGGF